MHINIFGVGRSGTKAVQLYLAYLLAEKYDYVKINYEPFYWKNRFLDISYRGIKEHMNMPLIAINKKLPHSSAGYLESLCYGHEHSVTKFIRGNGRIQTINSIMTPDVSIVIIRDLYSVLSSVAGKSWDLLGNGLINTFDYKRLLQYINVHLPEIRKQLKYINDRMDMNALYWFVMNHIALKECDKDTHVIYYDNITAIEQLALSLGFQEGYNIRDNLFEGDNIHTQYPLMSEKTGKNPMERWNRGVMNSAIARKMHVFPVIENSKTGTIDCIAKSHTESPMRYGEKTVINIGRKHIYDDFNEQIKSKYGQFIHDKH